MHSIPRAVLIASLLFAPLAQGAETTPPGTEQPPLDQVTVEATRINVGKLAKEVQDSEYRFYKRYNQLNKNKDYAINCITEANTGSRFQKTDCQPVFKTNAERKEAQQFIEGFGFGDQVTGTPGGVGGPVHVNAPTPPPPAALGSPTSAAMDISAGRPGFSKNMQDVTRASPELTKMAEEHAALWKKYYILYRKLNGASPLPEETSAAPPSSPAAPK